MFESEEYRIVRRIKEYIKNKKPSEYYYIMLRNGRILNIDDYRNMVISGKINPMDAYVYAEKGWASYKANFYYPFIGLDNILVFAYLSKLAKLGFYFKFFVVPATGLRYVADVAVYEKYLAIEVSNLDTVVNNTNLRNIVVQVLDGKVIDGEEEITEYEYDKISGMFSSQRLFAGHSFTSAWNIIDSYYAGGNKSLAKEVSRIAIDYDRIFHPYRVCYNMDSWKEIDCLSIKLV